MLISAINNCQRQNNSSKNQKLSFGAFIPDNPEVLRYLEKIRVKGGERLQGGAYKTWSDEIKGVIEVAICVSQKKSQEMGHEKGYEKGKLALEYWNEACQALARTITLSDLEDNKSPGAIDKLASLELEDFYKWLEENKPDAADILSVISH